MTHLMIETISFEDMEKTDGMGLIICAIGSINSHYFHIIGDKLINPIP